LSILPKDKNSVKMTPVPLAYMDRVCAFKRRSGRLWKTGKNKFQMLIWGSNLEQQNFKRLLYRGV
ncbi:MAG: hypothetical protein OEV50_05065, partial [Candidatus Aminicenantes bacterium]|nr:hypothetical protein [Candidatus Aminicenantes bacterium]